MTFVNHWGKWVDSDLPTTGVVSIHSVGDSLYWECDYHSIDATFEGGLLEYRRARLAAYHDRYGADRTPSPRTIQRWNDAYAADYMNDGDQTYLIGQWVRDPVTGLFEHDPEGEYAAIVGFDGFMTVQIVHSIWVNYGSLCSPCFPGQIDIDNPGEFLGYDLPPSFYDGAPDRDPSHPAPLHWIADEKRAYKQKYTIKIEVLPLRYDGVILQENIESFTVQSPRSDLRMVKNIARYGWDIAGDSMRSLPDD